METPENMEKENNETILLNMEVKVNPDNKKQVLLTMSGIERRTAYEFSSEEDAETASRLGGQIFNWFVDASKLKCTLVSTDVVDNPEAGPFPE